jgi:hypothetical protein
MENYEPIEFNKLPNRVLEFIKHDGRMVLASYHLGYTDRGLFFYEPHYSKLVEAFNKYINEYPNTVSYKIYRKKFVDYQCFALYNILDKLYATNQLLPADVDELQIFVEVGEVEGLLDYSQVNTLMDKYTISTHLKDYDRHNLYRNKYLTKPKTKGIASINDAIPVDYNRSYKFTNSENDLKRMYTSFHSHSDLVINEPDFCIFVDSIMVRDKLSFPITGLTTTFIEEEWAKHNTV